MEGIVRPLWRDAVVDTDPRGRERVNRITYEICALEALRDQLRCKEVWVAGADRYRNPDDDVPADFAARRDEHYAALDLPRDAEAFIAGLQDEMRTALDRFDAALPRDADVPMPASSAWPPSSTEPATGTCSMSGAATSRPSSARGHRDHH